MNRRPGFTPFELVVTMTLLLMLFSFLIPFAERLRRTATSFESRDNLREIALACHNYNAIYKNLPPIAGKAGDNTGTIHYHLLPFLNHEVLFKKSEGAVWKNGSSSQVIGVFLDKRDTTGGPDHKFKGWLATTNYAANWMVFKDGKSSIPDTFTDGTSNTLLFAQRYQVCNDTQAAWGYAALHTWAPMFGYYNQGKFQSAPRQADCDPTVPQSIASPAILVALGDGGVRTVAPSISPETWWFATDPADGNELGDDWND
ncbi:MAG: DUF1559 domain-containing protein [Planctomycetes bacterium]|nr:DUF1559 domain-containing protein [Planctomycetota bacterium]